MHNIYTTLKYPDTNFFSTLHQAPNSLLMLDYDGTLAPFTPNRFEAKPYAGVRELLTDISNIPEVKLVIITGRPIKEIVPLLNMPTNPEIWGSHGWEHLLTDGYIEEWELPDNIRSLFLNIQDKLQASIPENRVDIKTASLAVHWRGLPEVEKNKLELQTKEICKDLNATPGIDLKNFDGGLEIRAEGRDKGTSVRLLLNESDSSTFAAYLGDDATDEDAFKALQGKGEGILVRNEIRETHANWWLKPPADLINFLHHWKEVYSR